MQSYMRERVARQQFLVSLALEAARREHAVAGERRDAAERFERSFGYICHEVRNPLHGVCAGVQALQDGRLSGPEAAEELASISEGLSLTVTILNDLVDLQRLRSGNFAVNRAPTALRRVLEGCVSAARPAAARCEESTEGIRLELDGSVPGTVRAALPRLRVHLPCGFDMWHKSYVCTCGICICICICICARVCVCGAGVRYLVPSVACGLFVLWGASA